MRYQAALHSDVAGIRPGRVYTGDRAVAQALQGRVHVHFVRDQLIAGPTDILLKNGQPYKIFTPYAKVWREQLTPARR